VDRTGRPGPSTWEIGAYPEGGGDLPVGGVSWYEAAAYARFVGKELPTVHHWRNAFGTAMQAYLLPLSNVQGSGPTPVGASGAASVFATYDMAGNVREWCFNETNGQRFILGGGWNDPDYMAILADYAQPAFDRSEANGIRLVRYEADDPTLDLARRPVARAPAPDFRDIPALSDEVFEIYRRQFAYDALPLEDVVESVDTTANWTRERVTFDATGDDERMVLYLYKPLAAAAPLQTVVYFPGSAALTQRSFEEWRTVHFDFVLKSVRAVAFPIYKGTFERDAGFESAVIGPNSNYREHVIQWMQELGRSVDYLETRDDLDTARLAYYGYSWGGRLASIALALEPRFDAAVLYVAGYGQERPFPEVDEVTYSPRVSTPVLMLSGRYDDVFPLETHSRPMYDRLGTPAEHKRFVVSDGGHFVPRTQLIEETLNWLDRYLGPTR
jgi:dienelactone hydrolase